jgi:serine/threonine protein kinase
MFAVKTIQFKNLSTLDDWHLLEVELEILLCTDSPSVVSVCDVYETECCMHIVLPYMAGGHLEQAIKSELDVLEAARQMISGVKYLHDRGIVHRDIKLDNFVWESPGDNLSIIDFGLGAFWAPNDKKLQLPCGTPGYMSPDMRTGKGYTSKTDIWSLGISILQLLVGEIPSCFEDAVPPSQQEVDAQIARAYPGNDNLAQHFLAFFVEG